MTNTQVTVFKKCCNTKTTPDLSAGAPKYGELLDGKNDRFRKCHPGVLNDYVSEIQAKFGR